MSLGAGKGRGHSEFRAVGRAGQGSAVIQDDGVITFVCHCPCRIAVGQPCEGSCRCLRPQAGAIGTYPRQKRVPVKSSRCC